MTSDEVVAAFLGGGGSTTGFKVRASNGYLVQVGGSARRVTLTASGPAGTATYSVPGKISGREISANFGKRGRVDVSFRPSRRMRLETAPNRCKGKPRVTRWGVFVGTIRFKGERGYTRVRTTRAAGRTQATPRWKCKRRRGSTGGRKPPKLPSQPDGQSEDAVVLEISNRRTGVEAGIIDLTPKQDGGFTLVIVGAEERRKRMQISRFAFELAQRHVLSVDDALTTATVAPSAVLLGTGTFQRNPGGPVTGSGSLAAALPGMARVPLIGPGNRVRLYRLDEDGIANAGPEEPRPSA
ncbi:MAG TPA: hypothetical protein VFD39_10605 [Trueperaceae bacterium]|nr:hypothetical protein [Trueperaceae bacterium]